MHFQSKKLYSYYFLPKVSASFFDKKIIYSLFRLINSIFNEIISLANIYLSFKTYHNFSFRKLKYDQDSDLN